MPNPDVFTDIANQTVERYTGRLNRLGEDVKALGWGSDLQQFLRFKNFCEAVDLNDISLLDIGCGFGDLLDYLRKEKIKLKSYTGWDINDKFVNIANQKYASEKARFDQFDILNSSPTKISANVCVMLGLLNYNYKSKEINMSMTKKMINNAFSAIDHCLYVDFLSLHRDESYPEENAVFYHDPSEMIKIALSITSNVKLLHNYAPIPQKEFALVIYK